MNRQWGNFKYDLRQGMRGTIIRCIWGMLPFIMTVCLMFKRSGEILDKPSFFDCLIYLFKGIDFYIPGQGKQFEVPALWLAVQIFICIVAYNYPKDNYEKYGGQTLTRIGSKRTWWISKCAWMIQSVFLYYIIGYSIMFIACILAGSDSVLPNKDWNLYMTGIDVSLMNFKELWLVCCLIPIAASIALSISQMTMSFIFNPIYSFIAIIAYLVISVYYNNMFLFGANSMILRNGLISINGQDNIMILTTDVIVMTVFGVGGYFYLKRLDVVRKNV